MDHYLAILYAVPPLLETLKERKMKTLQTLLCSKGTGPSPSSSDRDIRCHDPLCVCVHPSSLLQHSLCKEELPFLWVPLLHSKLQQHYAKVLRAVGVKEVLSCTGVALLCSREDGSHSTHTRQVKQDSSVKHA